MIRRLLLAVAATTLVACARPPRVAPLDYTAVATTPDAPFRAHAPEWSGDADAPLAAESFVRPDGLHVVLVRRATPVVAARLVLARGPLDSPRLDPTDVGFLLGAMLEETTTRPRVEDAAAAIGARLDADVTLDGAAIRLLAPRRSFDAAIDLLGDVALHPALRDATLRRLRARATRTKDGGVPAPAVANNVGRALFGLQHPYGQPRGVEPRRALGLDAAGLEAMRAALLQPSSATLIVAGDLDRATLERAIDRALPAWPAAPNDPPPAAPPLAPTERHVVHVPHLALETVVEVAAVGPKPSSADWLATVALATWLGGMPSSAVNIELRDEMGSAYHLGAETAAHREASIVAIAGAFHPEDVTRSVRSVLEAVERARVTPLSDAALAVVRASLVARWRYATSSAARTCALFDAAAREGIPLEQVATYPQRVAALTAADVQRAARTYLAEDALRLVVVGPANERELVWIGLGPVVRRNADGRALGD